MNNLAEKIAAASTKVGALATDKRNAQQGYDYISADKILDRAGGALASVGVILIPAITQEEVELRPTANNKERFDAKVTFVMTLSDGETTLEFPWVGRGSDYAVPDKATYKAITSGHKYFLAKLLNIGVGNEDGEHDGDVEAVQRKQPTQRQEPVPARTPLTTATQHRLHALGVELTGSKEAWDEARPGLVQWASSGAVTSSNDLTENEARKLIAGIEKKLADAAQAKLDAPTPEERGATSQAAKPGPGGSPGQRMANRMQAS